MRLLKPLLIIFFIGFFSAANAQDIHFSQYYMSPMTLNPALTGGFEGTVRFGGIYRDQWGSFLGSQFRTPSFFVDAPVINGFEEGRDWVGAGVNILNDQVGEYDYNNLNVGMNGSYHRYIGGSKRKPSKTVVSLGVQVGLVQKSVDATQLRFGEQWDASGSWTGLSPDATGLPDNRSYTDISGGLAVRTAFGEDDKVRLTTGVSVFHINTPQDGLLSATDIPVRIVFHANSDIDLNDKLVLSPGVFFQTINGAREILPMAMIGYRMTDDLLLQYGQGFRFGDATNSIVGLQYKNLKVGVSYDFNVSTLNNLSSARGGVEVAASYMVSIFADPKVEPVIFCPGF